MNKELSLDGPKNCCLGGFQGMKEQVQLDFPWLDFILETLWA